MSGGSAPSPFFTAPSVSRPARGRLLLIAPAFPPNPTVGALRWERLAPSLADAGWALDVITLSPPAKHGADEQGAMQLPPGTRVYGIPEPVLGIQDFEQAVWNLWRRARPARGRAVRGALTQAQYQSATLDGGHWQLMRRAYFASVDYARWGWWARCAARLARRIIRSDPHRAIITSGPPQMVHEGGRLVARASGLPLVLDFRDPWSLRQKLSEWEASPLWHRLARRYEARAVRSAALVIANTDLVRDRMRSLYPTAPGRFITVMNGSDPEELPRVQPAERFTVAFAGTIYLDRDPRPLFAGAARVVRELGLTPRDFQIEMTGDVFEYGGVQTTELARRAGLEGFITLEPRRPRAEALASLARAAVLVSLPLDSELTIPAKIFEYVQLDAWLLVLAQPESATAQLLAGTGADVVAPQDVDAIAGALRQRYLRFQHGERPRAIASDGRFGRATQARVLIAALRAVTGDAPDTR